MNESLPTNLLSELLPVLDGLAVAFLGGLLSGIGVYVVRQKRRRDRLRRAICIEINQTPFDTVTAAYRGTDSLETPVIDSNLNKIHLLSTGEISTVVKYRTHMAKIRDHNERRSEDGSVEIPRRFAEKGSELATEATDTLASNIWNRPELLNWLKRRLSSDEERTERGMTEKEINERIQQMMEEGQRMKESGELRKRKLKHMDTQEVIDEHYES